MMFPKPSTWRSEKHRRNVASLNCACCGRSGPSQCAHANYGKGLGLKVSDILTFPMCPSCHAYLDSGGGDRDKRRLKEWEHVDACRAELISRSLWTREHEQEYQTAIEPFRRLHEDVA